MISAIMSLDNKTFKKCFMVPVSQTGNSIFLPDGVEIKVGRSTDLGISDLTCSRHQGNYMLYDPFKLSSIYCCSVYYSLQ